MELLLVQLEQERHVELFDAYGRVLLVEVGDVEHVENERQDGYEHARRVRHYGERVNAMKSQWIVARCWYESRP